MRCAAGVAMGSRGPWGLAGGVGAGAGGGLVVGIPRAAGLTAVQLNQLRLQTR